MFFSFCAANKKRTKRKSSSLKTLRALCFSLMTGLSELGLCPALKHADKLFPPSTAMLTDRFNATYRGWHLKCNTEAIAKNINIPLACFAASRFEYLWSLDKYTAFAMGCQWYIGE
jgi:hypothetical protein